MREQARKGEREKVRLYHLECPRQCAREMEWEGWGVEERRPLSRELPIQQAARTQDRKDILFLPRTWFWATLEGRWCRSPSPWGLSSGLRGFSACSCESAPAGRVEPGMGTHTGVSTRGCACSGGAQDFSCEGAWTTTLALQERGV